MSSSLKSVSAVLVVLVVAGLLAVLTQSDLGASPDAQPSPARFTPEGKLIRPEGYRLWVYVGTPLTPNDMNNGKAAFPEFHNVYIDRGSFDHWQNSGEWREGTVIVKELLSVGSKAAVSGNGYFMGKFRGLEVTVKSKEQFPKEPGNWAYFSFGHNYPLAKEAAAFATASCNACHQSSAESDFVFTQYYPVLSAAAPGSDGTTFEAASSKAKGAAKYSGAVPAEANALFEWLKAGKYKGFAKETAQHPSTGPHTKLGLPVRVYYDPILASSLSSKNAKHPVGSAAIKEMMDANGRLMGWAAMIKTHVDSDGGKGWYWYEVTSTTDGRKPVAASNGAQACFVCHGPGKDYVLSSRTFK